MPIGGAVTGVLKAIGAVAGFLVKVQNASEIWGGEEELAIEILGEIIDQMYDTLMSGARASQAVFLLDFIVESEGWPTSGDPEDVINSWDVHTPEDAMLLMNTIEGALLRTQEMIEMGLYSTGEELFYEWMMRILGQIGGYLMSEARMLIAEEVVQETVVAASWSILGIAITFIFDLFNPGGNVDDADEDDYAEFSGSDSYRGGFSLGEFLFGP